MESEKSEDDISATAILNSAGTRPPADPSSPTDRYSLLQAMRYLESLQERGDSSTRPPQNDQDRAIPRSKNQEGGANNTYLLNSRFTFSVIEPQQPLSVSY